MNNSVFVKQIEDSLRPLSGKLFFSLEDLKSEISSLWNQLSFEKTCNLAYFVKSTNMLNLGIVTDIIQDKNAFFLLRILKIAPRKIIYKFDFELIRGSLLDLYQNVERIESEIKSKEDRVKELETEIDQLKSNTGGSLSPDNVPISRLYRLAASYQNILTHLDDIKDEAVISGIKKDVTAALRGQGMIIVEYDGTNEQFFNVTEDDNCEDVTMTRPAIISKDGKEIIAKGNLFKHI